MARKPPTASERDGRALSDRKLEDERRRDDLSRGVYNSRRWRKLRKWFIERNPLCRKCLELELTVPAVHVHHRIPIRVAPRLAFVVRNLDGLCVDCHGDEEAEYRRLERLGEAPTELP